MSIRLPPTLFETLPRVWKHPPSLRSALPSAHSHTRQLMGSTSRTGEDMQSTDMAEYGVETTQLNPAPGVELSAHQQLLTGSVLDLFAGRPSLKKLSLWKDDASFLDPLTIAEAVNGTKRNGTAQGRLFGYPAPLASSYLIRNPIEMDVKSKYKVAGIGTEQTIQSKIKIYYDNEGKITKVEDRWNDKLPESAFTNALRKLNSVVVPAIVSVPKSEEEEAK